MPGYGERFGVQTLIAFLSFSYSFFRRTFDFFMAESQVLYHLFSERDEGFQIGLVFLNVAHVVSSNPSASSGSRSAALAHVQLAGDHVCNKPGAVFPEQLDLAAGAVDGGVYVGGCLVEIAGRWLLLVRREVGM